MLNWGGGGVPGEQKGYRLTKVHSVPRLLARIVAYLILDMYMASDEQAN